VSKVEVVRGWLRGLLADGPVASRHLFRLAGSEGFSKATVYRALEAPEFVKHKIGQPGEDHQTWAWGLANFDVGDDEVRSDAFVLLSSLTLEDGRAWGAAAEQFQRDDAAAILAESGPRMHFLTRPRGASKTSDLAAVSIAWLLEQSPARGRAFAFAVDADQAGLLLDALVGFVARTPELAGALTIESRRVTANHNQARLDVMAADSASAWGLKGDLFICDEVCQWPVTPGPTRLWEAILSAVPKVDGCRLVLLSTAGSPDHPSRKLLDQARESSEWHVSEVLGPCPWVSEAALAEQWRLLPESSYRRLHLNQWVSSEDRLVSAEDLEACVVAGSGPLEPERGTNYVLSLDMAFVNDQAVLCVCHREPDGLVVLDRMHVWQGSRVQPIREHDVEQVLVEAWRAYHRPRVVLDPWQTKGLAQRLRTQGVRVEEFTFSSTSVGRIALSLYRLLRDHEIELYDDEDLLTELARVQLRENAVGQYRMDHAHGEHDDRAVALAMCAHSLLERPAPRGGIGVSAASHTI
jgi:phage terminase large subunit-like protein